MVTVQHNSPHMHAAFVLSCHWLSIFSACMHMLAPPNKGVIMDADLARNQDKFDCHMCSEA